ncbi:hypothetical protein RRG08_050019 [Elysia crispata]|uniref:Uncharacterized protein n=1 Tax=Elysia crispata TaxID=231223 RepID=A0AAE1B9H5_9GAST|nr:hypothetical protein RRG08_050019 [Elysia crispata]
MLNQTNSQSGKLGHFKRSAKSAAKNSDKQTEALSHTLFTPQCFSLSDLTTGWLASKLRLKTRLKSPIFSHNFMDITPEY